MREIKDLIELHKTQIVRLERIIELHIWVKNLEDNKLFPPTKMDKLRIKKWQFEISQQYDGYIADNAELN